MYFLYSGLRPPLCNSGRHHSLVESLSTFVLTKGHKHRAGLCPPAALSESYQTIKRICKTLKQANNKTNKIANKQTNQSRVVPAGGVIWEISNNQKKVQDTKTSIKLNKKEQTNKSWVVPAGGVIWELSNNQINLQTTAVPTRHCIFTLLACSTCPFAKSFSFSTFTWFPSSTILM